MSIRLYYIAALCASNAHPAVHNGAVALVYPVSAMTIEGRP